MPEVTLIYFLFLSIPCLYNSIFSYFLFNQIYLFLFFVHSRLSLSFCQTIYIHANLFQSPRLFLAYLIQFLFLCSSISQFTSCLSTSFFFYLLVNMVLLLSLSISPSLFLLLPCLVPSISFYLCEGIQKNIG